MSQRKFTTTVDEVLKDIVEMGAEATRAVEAGPGVTDPLEVFPPRGLSNLSQIIRGGKMAPSALEGRHQERAVADGAASGAFVSGDETFVTPSVVEDSFEPVVGGRKIRVIVSGEEPGSEMPGRLEHLPQDRCPGGVGVAFDGFTDFGQEPLEGAGDSAGGSLRAQELGGPPDEVVKEPHVAGRGLGEVQGNVDVLGELAQQKR